VPLETHVVSDVDEQAPFVERWRELAVASGNLFVTPDWYFSWFAVFGDRFAARLIVCYEDGELVGVLPLAQELRWPRALRFAGDASADRTAPLAARAGGVVEKELLAEAQRIAPSMLVLTHLEQSGARAAASLAGHSVAARSAALPFATIGDGWDAYLARRSRNFRADLKRKEKSLRAAGEVEFRRTESERELGNDLGTFFRLHDERWDDRGGSTSSTDRVRLFLAEVAGRCLARGWLRLWQLTSAGEPAASFLGWSLGPTYSYYLAGFDSRLARHSPGTVLLAHTIRDAIGDGCERYDLLLGDESYKARFADGVDIVQSLVLARRNRVPLLLARFEAGSRAALRRLPDRPKVFLQHAAARAGSRLPLTRTR
jgi:CelD/BcsL family acetyltransferase involved in cellulose biosynthesis